MPAIVAPKKSKSAIKRARQAEVKNTKNRSVKKMLSTLTKNVEREVANKSGEGASSALQKVVAAIDKAAHKGIIHKNTASRRVARLTKLVNSLTPSEAA